MSKKLIINSLSGTSLFFINIIVAFIMSPVMVKTLGNSGYGLWEMVMGVVGYMGILDLGLGSALLRHVAVSQGQEDQQDLQETISTAMALFLGLGAVVTMVFVLLSFYPQILTSNEAAGTERLELVLLLFAANAILIFPLKLYTGVLMGLQKHHLINSSRSVLIITRAALAYYLLFRFPGKGLLILAGLEIVTSIIQFALYATALRMDKSVPHFSPFLCQKKKIHDLFGYSTKSAILIIASRLQFASMPFVIGKALGLGFIVYFVLPNRLVDYAKGFSMSIGFPLTSYFAGIIGKNDSDSLKTGWLTTSFVLQIITVSMPLYLFFCGETFLKLWIGAEYASASHWVFYALLVGLTAESFSPNARQILMAKAQHGGVATVSIIMSICSIPLSFLGAKMFGVAGAALGSSLVTGIISCITLIMTCRTMNTSPVEYFNRTILPLIIPVILLGMSLWGGDYFLDPKSYRMLLFQVLIGSFVYIISIWMFSLPQSVRTKFIDKLALQFAK